MMLFILIAVVVGLLVGRAIIMRWLGTSELVQQQKQIIELLQRHLETQAMLLETLSRTHTNILRTTDSPAAIEQPIVTQRTGARPSPQHPLNHH